MVFGSEKPWLVLYGPSAASQGCFNGLCRSFKILLGNPQAMPLFLLSPFCRFENRNQEVAPVIIEDPRFPGPQQGILTRLRTSSHGGKWQHRGQLTLCRLPMWMTGSHTGKTLLWLLLCPGQIVALLTSVSGSQVSGIPLPRRDTCPFQSCLPC